MADQPTERPHVCATCGEPHNACLAHNRDGLPCKQFPMDGQDVCKAHGGKSPRALEAAKQRIERTKAAAAVRTYGLPRDVEPHTALREEIARTAGAIDWLQSIVAAQDADTIGFDVSVIETTDRMGGGPAAGADFEQKIVQMAQPSVWVRLLLEERKHLVNVCKTAIQCGIAEREVRVLEEQGRIIANIFRAIEADAVLALDERQKERHRLLAVQHLTAVPALPSGGD